MKEASATAVPDAEASKEVTRIVPREPSGGVIPEGLKETPIAPPPEIERKPEPMREASATAVKRAEERAGPAKDAFPESSRKELTEAPKKIPAAPPPEAKRKPEPTWEASTTAVKRPEESGGLVKDALLEPSRKEGRKAPRESPAASPLEAKRKSDPVKEIPDPALKIPALPTREAKAIPLPPNKTAIPEAAKIPTSSLGLPAVSRESEVKQFLAGYTDRYNRKDIEGFLSFFSPKAVQNQKDDIEKIRKVYASFFQQNEELRYTVRNVKIEPHKDGLQVMGDYELEGILKKGRERKVWRGQVRWVLMKDKETLKVLSLDYQPQKSRD
jgi:ketosteroid isomerase-like protein